ncbi:biliverdin-producing heme oxygenase [Aureimonas leprariae]|uniref:Biliverdin-producing heme oxygenase n=1 Tax=Plantimonas leprariae TaxID=2615207 RepID=A0A7V7TX59_9HYPH|nr:biliverdin-producing heme oxygenase [Aureimonas leprariae]KAB0680399.1 biliverdin-producing heme oxygenase [Aureimonas leprariae]
MPEPSLRSRLRAETRPAHERLDASFAGLAEGDPTDYGLFLRMNEACHGAIEPLLAASPLAAARPRSAAGDLHAAALADVEAMRLRRIVPAAFPLAKPTLAQSLGIAYVVEGSKLGARQILRRLRKAADEETDRLPVAFLERAAGGADGFKAFLEMAETLVATRAEQDVAVEAADATFGYFLDVVRRAGAGDERGGRVN